MIEPNDEMSLKVKNIFKVTYGYRNVKLFWGNLRIFKKSRKIIFTSKKTQWNGWKFKNY
jgi:hypothetical protein